MTKKLLLFTLIFFLSFKVVIDTDYVWHLRAGENILETKSIPMSDLFSFSASNYPYVYYSWGSEVLIATAYKLLGNLGVSILYAAISTLTIYLIYKTARVISKKEPFLPLFVLFAPLAYAVGGGRVRSFGFLLFAVLYLFFSKLIYEKSRLVWFIPLVFVAWVNLHGSFILGILTLMLLSVLALVTRKDFSSYKTIVIVNILSLVATLGNPYFFRVWSQVLQISGNYYTNLQYLNLDWQSLAAKEGGGWIFASLAATLALFIFLIKNRIDLSQKLLLVIFLALSVLTARFVLALFVFFMVTANQLTQELINKTKRSIVDSKFLHFLSLLLFFVLLLLSLINLLEVKFAYSSVKNYSALVNTKYPQNYSFMKWPYEGGLFITQNLEGGKILNEANWAGLLLLLDPHIKVFYYGAMDNFLIRGKPFVLEYLELVNAKNNWEQKLEYYKVDTIFLPNSFPLTKILSNNSRWEIKYKDDTTTILVKKR